VLATTLLRELVSSRSVISNSSCEQPSARPRARPRERERGRQSSRAHKSSSSSSEPVHVRTGSHSPLLQALVERELDSDMNDANELWRQALPQGSIALLTHDRVVRMQRAIVFPMAAYVLCLHIHDSSQSVRGDTRLASARARVVRACNRVLMTHSGLVATSVMAAATAAE